LVVKIGDWPDDGTMDDDRVAALEKRVAKLEKQGKDGWDKFQIVATLMIPAAVAFAGYYFSQALANAQTASSKALADSQQASEERRAQITAAISQAELVSTFMKSLLSADTAERNLAIQAVLLALPDSGPQLVAVLQNNVKTRDEAIVALRDRRTRLVDDVFAEDAGVRQQATDHLVAGFRNDPQVVDTIAQKAQNNASNANGIYSSALVLKALPTSQLRANQARVQQFVQIANQREKTQALGEQIARQAQ
jgi:hypothetical protein